MSCDQIKKAACLGTLRHAAQSQDSSCYLLMVRFTVYMCVIPAAAPVPVPVIVMEPVPVCDDGLPEQPPTTTKTNIATAIPNRVRNRCVIGIMNNMQIPRTRKTTWRIDVGGGVLIVLGGTTTDMVAVTMALTVSPTFPLAGMVQDDTFIVPVVQLKLTAPVNPAKPLITTGIEPATPLVKLAVAGTVKLKSPVAEPVPVSAIAITFGAVPICSVAVSAPAGTSVGVKITPIVQLLAAANVAPQPVAAPGVATKSPMFAPLTLKVTGRAPVELFVTVTDIDVLGVFSN
jgi:hypothetical protein